jgi:hypothetical protein
MVNLTLSEATLNAARAALELRVGHLEAEVTRLQLQAADAVMDAIHWGVMRDTEDLERALVWNIAALHETKTAVEDFSEARIADHPADATWQGWTEGELVAAFGK